MCTTCGCGHGETRIEGKPVELHEHAHRHDDGTVHSHPHADERRARARASRADEQLHWHQHADGTLHSHVHGGGTAHPLGAAAGLGAVHAPGIAPARIVQIEQDILAKNDAYAAREPAAPRRSRHLRAEPGVEPRIRQDDAARAHDRGAARAARRSR